MSDSLSIRKTQWEQQEKFMKVKEKERKGLRDKGIFTEMMTKDAEDKA